MSSERYVVGLGEILWDMLPAGKQLGGAPANFAYQVHAQGVPASVVSAVGEDELGAEIRQRLEGWGMDTRTLEVSSEFPTGTVSVTVDANGLPQYIIHENVAWDHIHWRPELEALAAQTRAVCYGSLGQRHPVSRETIQRFLHAVPSDCLRVCDINLRQHYYSAEVITASLEIASVLKLNHEELPVVTSLFGLNGTDTENLNALLSRFHIDLIAVTRGGNGSLLITSEQPSYHPGIPVKVVDTIGAGDAFTAALIVGLLQGDSLDAINDKANRRAAYVCSHAGATG